MDYGYLKFKAQNGKSGIFWEQEKKKTDRKFGYKRKDQRYTIRKDPQNIVDIEPEPEQSDDKTPKANFIERNRNLAAGKNKGKKPTLRPLKQSPTGTVTLTQDQLNTILASVGKVATGEEDNLRISIDSKKNSITIESPRKSRDGDYYDHHSAESGYDDDDDKYNDDKNDKEVKSKKKTRPKKEEETTIFSLLEEFSPEKKKPSKSSKKEHTEDKNKKKERKKVDDENNNYGSDRENVNERKSRKEESSREIRHSEKRIKEVRDRSRDRERSRKRDGSRSREHDRRRRRNNSENDNDDRENTPERKSRSKREKNEAHENRKNISKDKDNDRNKASESDKKEENIEKKVVTPREIAGIPMSLPWKHMTLGERRRLMLARIEAEAAIKEIEKKKFEIEEREKNKSEENHEDNSHVRKDHERHDRKSSERKDKDRYRKDYDRSDRDSKRKERERDRNNHRYDSDDDNDHDDHQSRHNKKGSRDRRRYSPEQQDSDDDYYDRDHRKKDSRSHRRRDSPDSRERRHRDRRRERTPSDDDRDEKNTSRRTEEKSPDRAASKPPTGLPPPPKPLTLAEKKKLQWERDRIELAKQYDPWGRPGAGAPIRTKSGSVAADYKTRQEETLRASMEEMEAKKREQKEALIREMEKSEPTPKVDASQNNVPHAMRTSFMFGQVAPDSDQLENTKEIERQQWLQELDKQKEEKRLRQVNSKANATSQETWADKFTNHKPAGFPNQLKEPPAGYPDPYSPRDKTLDGGRVSSAPSHIPDKDEDKTYIRGQNVFMDPVTRNEMEEKRKRLLEHQQAVMEQVQQKQREKQRERELKMKEDMEEEMKLQAERDRIKRQFEQEQNKIKMKEVRRQQEVDKLKMAMDEAHESAVREKISRRMQHLEEGGHDTTHLKATLQDNPQSGRYLATDRDSFRDHHKSRAKLTPRNNNQSTLVQPEYVPGLNLELSPRTGPTHRSHREAQILENAPYIENRVLTPSRFRHGIEASREFGTQTVEFGTNTELGTRREESEVRIMYNAQGKRVRVKSAAMEETKKYQRKPEPPVEKKSKSRSKEEKEKEKPKWNFQNKRHKKPVKQSEKDLNFQEKKKHSEVRRLKREQELMNLVDMNRDRIPGYKGANSRGHSPVSDHEGHRSRSIERYSTSRRSKSHSPEHISSRREQAYRTTSPNITQRLSSPLSKVVGPIESSHNTARGRSPPVPALRYKKDNAYDVHLAEKQSARKYADGDPLEIPLMEGEFVPFMRTVEVLDPAHAGSPVPVSREATAVINARKAYLKGMKPGDYGKKANNYEDRLKVQGEEESKDPIMNPALVKDHPTHRQDAILQQLSSLKMNLMQRRRELETFSPTDFE